MVLQFFEWMEGSALAVLFQSAVWYSPIIQVMHLVAVAVFAGALLVVDLRLLGTGLTQTPLRQVASDAQPWLIGALIALAITGTPSMASTSIKQYYSPFWWWKMETLVVGSSSCSRSAARSSRPTRRNWGRSGPRWSAWSRSPSSWV